MADKKKPEPGPKLWQGRYPITHDDHADELEAAAGIHEFRHGIARQDAEDRAHGDYVRAQGVQAAAHHLLGVRAAHAAGSEEAAMLHGQAYAASMRGAGHDPFAAPPSEVLDAAREIAAKAHSFKAHPADSMFAPQNDQASPEDARIRELMDKLKALRDRAVSAAKTEET